MNALIIVLIILGILLIVCGFVIMFFVLIVKDNSYVELPETWIDDEGNEYENQ